MVDLLFGAIWSKHDTEMAWVHKMQRDIRGHRQGGYDDYYHYHDCDASEEDESPLMGAASCSSSPIITATRPITNHHMHGDIMKLISKLCNEIVQEYPSGHTECFYEKVLSQYLYERSIPCITQVDCFVQRKFSQILVGRIDMEVAHTVLLELKVAPKIKQADMDQLWKYIRAKKTHGMQLEHGPCNAWKSNGHVG